MNMTPTTIEEPCIWVLPVILGRRLGVHSSTVVRWCEHGRIPAWLSPGGRWLIASTIADDLVASTAVAQHGRDKHQAAPSSFPSCVVSSSLSSTK